MTFIPAILRVLRYFLVVSETFDGATTPQRSVVLSTSKVLIYLYTSSSGRACWLIVFIGRRGFTTLYLAWSDTLVVAEVTYIQFTALLYLGFLAEAKLSGERVRRLTTKKEDCVCYQALSASWFGQMLIPLPVWLQRADIKSLIRCEKE